MSIEISNLNPAGSNLFAGEESFLSELKEADSSRVFGGGGHKKRKKNKSKSGSGRNNGSGSNSGNGYGGHGGNGGCCCY